MAPRRVSRFIASYVIVGLIVAGAVVWLAPGLLDGHRPVVEVREAPQRTSPTTMTAGSGPVSYADAVAAAAPAVVNVYSARAARPEGFGLPDDPLFRRFFEDRLPTPGPRRETSLGSGVIVSDDGHILTNNHVIEDADEIQVLLADGRTAPATLVGTDPESDLAVLRIELPDLPAVTMGDSESIRVGDVVLAIGNPFGVGQTVTQGIVSAKGRSELGLTTFENFIQTDAAINPGNSGGALVNAEGEVIGINTAIYSQSGGSMGIGFAIPASLAGGVLQSIIEEGRVIRGWIGVQVQGMSPQLADSFGLDAPEGVLIAGVLRGGPADEAGLAPGDVVLEVAGEPVADVDALLTRVTDQPPGSTIILTGLREGEPREWQVEVEERPTDLQQSTPRR
ncbi:S1C family serine protease [Spiribacter halobius]|uniref:Transcriptional regulator n=1 Tax=Sediminicurvatus halobius TaxID=2182432 RepID=A0A2U2N7X9_9GAMM|nr:Do family serine endopeptidase [Spiribacter halobius]PWG65192.1 transcriptional regulator [Spiribacter halobius]UEX78855.1 Do family serine endopeptidase [Spiribacter halobius]